MFQVIQREMLNGNNTRNRDNRKITEISPYSVKNVGLHAQKGQYNLYVNDTHRPRSN